mgnify:CR=1 FL=1
MRDTNSLSIFIVIFAVLFLVGITQESFSESNVKTVMIFVEPPSDEDLLLDEKTKNDDKTFTPKPNPSSPEELPSSFVTGNEYALNSNQIRISSDDGIELNNLLIKQIDEWKIDAEHMTEFWSRTEQVIMGNFGVVNALQNPLTENNYHIDGKKHAENVNSNLEYFVHERGYDINNLENVPNHMLTPKKYDLSRLISKQWENPLSNNLEIQHVRDLRDVAPNVFDFTTEQEMQMFRESVKTTSFDVVSALMPKLIVDESMFLPESELEKAESDQTFVNKEKNSSKSVMLDDESMKQQQNKKNDEIFQETTHIKNFISESNFQPNYSIQEKQQIPVFEIITSLIIIIASILGLIIIRKYNRRKSKLLVQSLSPESHYDYLSEVKLLLNDARKLHKNNHVKDAYEKFSQSIRVFYSNKLQLEKEIVTSDLIPLMKNFDSSEKSLVKNSLFLSDMIEFAKHTEDNDHFKKIISEFSKIISKEKI